MLEKKIRYRFHYTKLGEKIDWYLHITRRINKIGKAIYQSEKHSNPGMSKKECYALAASIVYADYNGFREIINKQKLYTTILRRKSK